MGSCKSNEELYGYIRHLEYILSTDNTSNVVFQDSINKYLDDLSNRQGVLLLNGRLIGIKDKNNEFISIEDLFSDKFIDCSDVYGIYLMNEEIQKKKAKYIRIHDSGDFYSIKYLRKWLLIAQYNKEVIFYAYTKSIKFFKDYNINLPDNFKVIFSEGSKTDNLINTLKDRHARIFKDVTTLLSAGYIDASNNDLKAITSNKKVGLVYH